MFLVVSFISFVLAAYSRGNFLLGRGTGIVYAFVATLIVVLFIRALAQSPVSKLRLVCLILFALVVSIAFAFPALLNSDIQHFINKQTADRTARAELSRVFGADAAFRDLSVSTIHLKAVNVTIHGEVPMKTDLDRLRSQVLDHCSFVDKCGLNWRIRVRDESQTYTGQDREPLDVTPG